MAEDKVFMSEIKAWLMAPYNWVLGLVENSPKVTVTNTAKVEAENGKIATLGTTTDAAVVDPAAAATAISLKKGLMSLFISRMGEAQAVPTANTMLGRLKALETILGIVDPNPGANTVQDRLRTLALLAGALNAAAVTDPAADAASNQLLKGLLKQLQGTGTGSQPVTLTGSNVADVIFHDAVSATGNGLIYSVAGYKTLTVEIYGTSTGRQINFMARGPAGADRPITGLRISDLATDTGTTGTAEIWQFDIAGLVSVLCPIASVAGGNVSVRGRVVA